MWCFVEHGDKNDIQQDTHDCQLLEAFVEIDAKAKYCKPCVYAQLKDPTITEAQGGTGKGGEELPTPSSVPRESSTIIITEGGKVRRGRGTC